MIMRTAAIALLAVATRLSISADAFAIGGVLSTPTTTSSRVVLQSTTMDMEAEIRREVCLSSVEVMKRERMLLSRRVINALSKMCMNRVP
jgi:hypothetical protein